MKFFVKVLGLFLLSTMTAFAHSTEGAVGGLVSGFLHPIMGPDHVIAMVAVGLWGAFLGRPMIWVLPIVFPMVMAFGGVLGIVGVPLPAVEVAIALSGLILGLLILIKCTPPLWVAALIVAFFAIFHGYAHGLEMPQAASALMYAIGFVIGTGLLHLVGILFGLLNNLENGECWIRAMGAVIALIGLYFLLLALFGA